jgi:ADP-ribose pyrophosphatase YjhB (NUDIX family)
MEDAEDQAASAVMEDDEGPLPQNTDRELSSPDVLRAKAAEAQKARVGMAETMAEATEALEAVQRSMNSSLVDDETANEAEAEIEDEVGEELVDTVPENTIDEDPVDTGLQSGEVVEQDETDADAEGIGKQVSGAEDTVEENVASGEHQGEAADGGEDGTVTEDMVEENVAPSGNQVEAVERGEGEAQEPLVDDGGNKLSSEQAQVRWAFVGGFVGNTQEVHENVASGGKQVEEADVGANGKGTEDMVEENVASSGNQGEAADGFADGTVTEDMVEENVAPSGNQAEEVERGEGEAQEPLVDDGGNKLSSEQAQVRWAFVGGFVGSTQEVHENVASSGKQDEETDGVVNKTQKSVVDAQDRGMFDEKQLQSSEKEDIACEWSQTSAGSPKQQSEPTESGPFDIEGSHALCPELSLSLV